MGERWWSRDTVALITGANKGIGLQIARDLATQGMTVILTSRDEARGKEALKSLQEHEGLDTVVYHQLDICSPESVQEIVEWAKQEYGSIDILINNAGVMLLYESSLDRLETARIILETNYYGLKRMTEAMLPLMKPGARIINISSVAGDIMYLNNHWRDKLQDIETLTAADIDECLKMYMDDVQAGQVTAKGWPARKSAYNENPEDITHYLVSKIAVNAYTRLVDHQLRKGRQIFVNCMCPGLTATNMTLNAGHSVEVGADTAVWLALVPASESPSGGFFMLRKNVGFYNVPFYCNGALLDVNAV